MAKKEEKEQQTIEGAADAPTGRVKDAARKYAKTQCQRMKLQEDEAVLKPALDKIMDEDGVEKLEVSFTFGKAGTIRYEVKRAGVAASFKITCKKLGGGDE